MKRILIILLMSLALTSCDSEETILYEVGDKVYQDGIIYEYISTVKNPLFESCYNDSYNVIQYSEELDYLSYHEQYYIDMTDVSIYDDMIEPSLWYNDLNAPINVEQISAYWGVFEESRTCFLNTYVSDEGFIIVDYTASLGSDVVIPKDINGNNVLGVGYKAFENASLKTIKFEYKDTIVLPYGFNNCSNLESIDFAYNDYEEENKLGDSYYSIDINVLFSCAISNCTNLTSVSGVNLALDAAFNNCNSLTTISNFNLFSKYISSDEEYQTALDGVNKPMFYKCENISDISGLWIKEMDNVYYFYNFSRSNSSLKSRHILYLKEDAVVDLAYNIMENAVRDEDSNKVIIPYMNVGYEREFSIKDPNESFLVDSSYYQWYSVVDNTIYCGGTTYYFYDETIDGGRYDYIFIEKSIYLDLNETGIYKTY